MLSSDFNWDDIFLGHYILSVFVGVVIIIITCIVSKKYNYRNNCNEKFKSLLRKELSDDDRLNSDGLTPPIAKKSPALVAEKVIKANMTEEQRELEYQVRQKQLAQIYELMMKQSDKFGSISLSDVEEQMKLYQ